MTVVDVVDAFLYAGERSMLDLRLATLDTVVDRFIAVEQTVTHQGEPRDVVSLDGLGRITGRFQHVVVDNTPRFPDRGGVRSRFYQRRERWHRDALTKAVRSEPYEPTTVVMMSDVDEIPDPLDVDRLASAVRATGRPHVCAMTMRCYYLDVRHPVHDPWLGTVAGLVGDLDAQRWRDDRGPMFDAGDRIATGWHLSWLGSMEERYRKLRSFSHAELVDVDLEEHVAILTDVNDVPLEALHDPLPLPEPIISGRFATPDRWWLSPERRAGPLGS